MRWQLPLLLLLIIASVLIIRHQRNMPYIKNSGTVFGTLYNITYQSDKDLQKEIEAELAKVDRSLSPFNKESVITAVNEGKDIEVDDMFRQVFTLAQKVSKDTEGFFDITVAPLVNAWGFGFKEGKEPTKAAIDSIRQFVGYDKVQLKGSKVVKSDPRLMLDCSAIAKGYGCDAVAALLKKNDVQNYMIEIGGEVVTKGVNAKRQEWRIGVQKPQDSIDVDPTQIVGIINISDKALATSGNYRNFYYKDGKKYAHSIDPHTGEPVQHEIVSATVVANNCATADAYATSFMVMGMEKAKAVAERHKDLKVLLIYIDSDGQQKQWLSKGLKLE